MQEQLFQAMILGLSGFTLVGVVSLKVSVARLETQQKHADENAKEYRSRMSAQVEELEENIKIIWKNLRSPA